MAARLTKAQEFWLRLPADHFQRDAAQTAPGPLMIVGGPGTGKTQALIVRVRALINSGVEPSKIILLTFSDRAAMMIRQKLREVLDDPEEADKVFVGTFHGRALAYLRRVRATASQGLSDLHVWSPQQARNALKTILNDVRSGPISEMTSREIDNLFQWDGLNQARWQQQPIPADSAHWQEVLKLFSMVRVSYRCIIGDCPFEDAPVR